MKNKLIVILSLLLTLTLCFNACELKTGDSSSNSSASDSSSVEEQYDIITIAQALEICAGLEDGQKTEERYYIKGTVVSIDKPQYGQMTVKDETGTISVYGTYSADGELRYSELEDKPYQGAEILLYASLQKFKESGEVYSGWIISFTNPQVEDNGEYTEMTVNQARQAQAGTLVKVTGVVACIAYANGKVPCGFYLVDNTNSIYVYDSQVTPRVSIGNTVTINAEKTYWILDTEKNNAEKFGYNGCCQLQNATLISNDNGNTSFDKSWIPDGTVKEVMSTPVTQDISSTIYKVNALITRKDGSGFTNYYIDDLDGKTGSYVYTQCNGSDFAWLDEFDGKICTVYLSAINAKSTASGCSWRFIPVEVIDEGYEFDLNDAAKYAVLYHGVDQFMDTYLADPALELVTEVSSALLGIDGATLSYSSSDENVVYFEGNVMHTKNNGIAKVTVSGSYGEYNGYSSDVIITVGEAPSYDSVNVSAAIAAAVDAEVCVKGIAGPSLVNQVGFYLIDETGILAIKVSSETMEKISLGDEVIVKGKRTQFKKADGFTGQACLIDSELLINYYGGHDYSTASFITTSTVTELYGLSVAEDHTAEAYIVTGKIVNASSSYSSNYYVADEEGNQILLYASSGNQWAFLKDYVGQTVTVEIAMVSWNQKNFYRGCVLAVYNEDGSKVVNVLNYKKD